MQTAEALLEIIHERGKRGLPLERLYRHLFNPELYLRAYGKIYRNDGAMTPGVDAETVDGMSLKKIQAIIEALRYERYRWTPVRRIYIDKKNSSKKRPLGLPTWSDKLLQEVIRSLLEAYYEPQFSDRSHGFRPGRGCHTALWEIQRQWRGTVWFIEGSRSRPATSATRSPPPGMRRSSCRVAITGTCACPTRARTSARSSTSDRRPARTPSRCSPQVRPRWWCRVVAGRGKDPR